MGRGTQPATSHQRGHGGQRDLIHPWWSSLWDKTADGAVQPLGPNFFMLAESPHVGEQQGLALWNHRQIVPPDPSWAIWWGHDKSRWSTVTQLGKVTCKGNTKRLQPYLLLQGGPGVLFYRFVSSAPVSSHTGNIALCFRAGSPFPD